MAQPRRDLVLQAHVKPNASRSELVVDGPTVRILVKAPPVEDRANAEAIRVLAKVLGVPKSSVELVRGRRGRIKRFRVSDVAAAPKAFEALFEPDK